MRSGSESDKSEGEERLAESSLGKEVERGEEAERVEEGSERELEEEEEEEKNKAESRRELAPHLERLSFAPAATAETPRSTAPLPTRTRAPTTTQTLLPSALASGTSSQTPRSSSGSTARARTRLPVPTATSHYTASLANPTSSVSPTLPRKLAARSPTADLAVVLRKPHKPDYSKGNAFCLTCILAVLGKMLEKCGEHRSSFVAELKELVPFTTSTSVVRGTGPVMMH